MRNIATVVTDYRLIAKITHRAGVVLLMLLVLSNCASRNTEIKTVTSKSNANKQWLVSLPKPWQLSKPQLAEILPQFHSRYPKFQERYRALAHWRLGTPYKIFNLGEESGPDLDPIFRLDVSDCTSHVLSTLSLAQSKNWTEARQNMIRIHYKTSDDGIKKPTYESRWHYTSDRIMNHSSTPSIMTNVIDESQLIVQTITLNQKQDGSEFLKLGWRQTVDVRYIPNQHITKELLQKLPNLTGVAFVKSSYFKMGIVTAHEGLIIDGKSLLHAGQSAGETVIEDFMDYYFTDQGAKFSGIMLYELLPMAK